MPGGWRYLDVLPSSSPAVAILKTKQNCHYWFQVFQSYSHSYILVKVDYPMSETLSPAGKLYSQSHTDWDVRLISYFFAEQWPIVQTACLTLPGCCEGSIVFVTICLHLSDILSFILKFQHQVCVCVFVCILPHTQHWAHWFSVDASVHAQTSPPPPPKAATHQSQTVSEWIGFWF